MQQVLTKRGRQKFQLESESLIIHTRLCSDFGKDMNLFAIMTVYFKLKMMYVRQKVSCLHSFNSAK